MNRAIKTQNFQPAVFSQLIPPDFRLKRLARCECTGAPETRSFYIGHQTKGKEENGGGRATRSSFKRARIAREKTTWCIVII